MTDTTRHDAVTHIAHTITQNAPPEDLARAILDHLETHGWTWRQTTCGQPDCQRPHKARGLCARHYESTYRKTRARQTARKVVTYDLDEVAYFVLSWREPPEQLAARLGVTPAAIARRARRHGRPDLAVVFEPIARAQYARNRKAAA